VCDVPGQDGPVLVGRERDPARGSIARGRALGCEPGAGARGRRLARRANH
jgi:hypothetical protein